MLGLLGGIIYGSAHGWTGLAPALLLLGLVLFAGFCHRQRTAPEPLIRPSLLHNRGFTAGLLLGVVAFAAVAGLLYVISLYLQQGLGRSPAGTALGLIRSPPASSSRRSPATASSTATGAASPQRVS